LHCWSSGLTGSIDFDIDWINRRPVFFYWGSSPQALDKGNPNGKLPASGETEAGSAEEQPAEG
jgi:hypothetical protein